MSFDEMVKALRDDPEVADWVRDKGDANDGRELHRIWDKAGEAADEIDHLIAEFNAKYMVVNEAGKACIYAPDHDPLLHRRFYNRMGAADLRLLYQNRSVQVGVTEEGNAIMNPAADVWLRHDNRRQYIGGIIFDPSGAPTPPDTLNLWQSFAVTPQSGSWEKLRLHVRDVICRGNREHYEYLIRWLARMVQRPSEQGEVAIVMRGAEGSGKGTLAKAMMRVLGQHALHISNTKHLVGNFNAHLRDCVLLFADEAFYAGDKAHVGVLKSLITEPFLTIEGKYKNAVQTPNFLHIMMASNEPWVVTAGLEARRFFCLEVSDARKDDHAYFGAIWAQMESGGYAAMLHDLLHITLTTFNVRRVPATEGLQQQKKLSLDTSNDWWLDVLHRGYVFRSRLGLEAHFSQWHVEVATAVLYDSYTDFAKERRERHPLGRETFGRFMVTLGNKPRRASNLVVGEHITDVANAFGGTNRKAETILQPRPPAYHLGTLDEARATFSTTIGLPIEWPQQDDQDQAA